MDSRCPDILEKEDVSKELGAECWQRPAILGTQNVIFCHTYGGKTNFRLQTKCAQICAHFFGGGGGAAPFGKTHLPFFFFEKKARKTHKKNKNKIPLPYRTPKIPGKKRENSQKKGSPRKGKKEFGIQKKNKGRKDTAETKQPASTCASPGSVRLRFGVERFKRFRFSVPAVPFGKGGFFCVSVQLNRDQQGPEIEKMNSHSKA